MRKLAVIAIIALTFTGMGIKNASAATLSETPWTGIVTFADAGNEFGLGVGDGISGFACWDDAHLVPVGLGEIEFGDPTVVDSQQDINHKMQWNLGLITLDHTNDSSYAGGLFPLLFTTNGIVDDVVYDAIGGVNGSPVDFFTVSSVSWGGFDSLGREIAGTYEIGRTAPKVDPIPEPTTVMLLGIGVLGLAGSEIRRRRKKSLETTS